MTFKPLLAATLDSDLTSIPYPLRWSPKLDGWRTMVRKEEEAPVTRKLNLLPNEKIRAALSRPELFGMDGELISGPVTDPDVYNSTQRIASKVEGPGLRETVWLYEDAKGKPKMSFEPVEGGRQIDETNYYVFDDFTDPTLPFEQRFDNVKRRIDALPDDLKSFVKLVPHGVVENDVDLGNIERICVEKGYEGVMLRSPTGRYKFGRSTVNEMILGKLKRFEDTDAIVIGFEELLHNDNVATTDALGHTKRQTLAENMRPGDTLGALLVSYPEFGDAEGRCGSGFSAALKQSIWNNRAEWIGATVVLKYQPSGMKDVPRFPVFKGRRED